MITFHKFKLNQIIDACPVLLRMIFCHFPPYYQYNSLMEGIKIERSQDLTVILPPQHKNTIIWIHGLNQDREMHLGQLIKALKQHLNSTKIIIPKAPKRYVTCMNAQASSWFDIKPRSQKSFLVPFDEAFSTEQVIDSFQRILKPIIVEQSYNVKAVGGRLIISGFSQGCGMSLHCLYSLPELIDGAIGISGYLFPITPFFYPSNPVHIIYGLSDALRPWEYTKVTYEGKISHDKITLIEGMGHYFDANTTQALGEQLEKMLK